MYVRVLPAFVAAAKQDDYRQPIASKIHAVSRTAIDPQFTDTATDALAVAEVAELESLKPRDDARPGLPVPQTVEPFDEELATLGILVVPDLEHGSSV